MDLDALNASPIRLFIVDELRLSAIIELLGRYARAIDRNCSASLYGVVKIFILCLQDSFGWRSGI